MLYLVEAQILNNFVNYYQKSIHLLMDGRVLLANTLGLRPWMFWELVGAALKSCVLLMYIEVYKYCS